MEPPPIIWRDPIKLKNYALQFKTSAIDALKPEIKQTEVYSNAPIKILSSQTPDFTLLESWEKKYGGREKRKFVKEQNEMRSSWEYKKFNEDSFVCDSKDNSSSKILCDYSNLQLILISSI